MGMSRLMKNHGFLSPLRFIPEPICFSFQLMEIISVFSLLSIPFQNRRDLVGSDEILRVASIHYLVGGSGFPTPRPPLPPESEVENFIQGAYETERHVFDGGTGGKMS